MKRKISIALATLLSFSCLSACGDKGYKGEIPVFEDSKGMVFAAYSGMTVENWSGTSRNVSTLTDEHFQKFVDAGFNRLLGIHEGARFKVYKNSDGTVILDPTIESMSQRAHEDAMIVMPLAEKYGVDYFVRDWAFYDMGYENNYGFYSSIDSPEEYKRQLRKMFDENNEYIHSSAYAGNFGRDEPGVDQFERLKWQIEAYYEIMDEYGIDGEFLLNLLPNYGSTSGFGGDFHAPVTYTEYLDRYFAELAPLLGYVCFDYYPFRGDVENGSKMRTTYISNLAAMATRCKAGGYELRTFVQTGADFTGLRDLTSVGDFRLQVYTNMAFGSRMMTYYEYGTFKSQHEGEFGLINLQDGSYNYTYDLAKKVNNEVHEFEDAYMHFNWDGYMCFSSLQGNRINEKFHGAPGMSKTHPRIGKVEIEHDALMGTFKDADGNDAFMLVNYNDPYFNQNNTITVEFKDASALLMYRFGKQEVVTLGKDGKYTFKLYPGEGRFIIPLK